MSAPLACMVKFGNRTSFIKGIHVTAGFWKEYSGKVLRKESYHDHPVRVFSLARIWTRFEPIIQIQTATSPQTCRNGSGLPPVSSSMLPLPTPSPLSGEGELFSPVIRLGPFGLQCHFQSDFGVCSLIFPNSGKADGSER